MDRSERMNPRPPQAGKSSYNTRRTPQQARGLETYERILVTAEKVLVREGFKAFTTVKIAEEAGINVATLYRYFSDKQEILVAMFERLNAEREAVSRDIVEAMHRGVPWRDALEEGFRNLVDIRRQNPGMAALSLAMSATPSLAGLLRRFRQSNARIISEALSEIAGLDPDTAMIVAQCAIEAHASLLDMWLLDYGRQEERIVEETRRMLFAYLALYFDRPRPIAGPAAGVSAPPQG
jgi:AcrR family transcriptional regulator